MNLELLLLPGGLSFLIMSCSSLSLVMLLASESALSGISQLHCFPQVYAYMVYLLPSVHLPVF